MADGDSTQKHSILGLSTEHPHITGLSSQNAPTPSLCSLKTSPLAPSHCARVAHIPCVPNPSHHCGTRWSRGDDVRTIQREGHDMTPLQAASFTRTSAIAHQVIALCAAARLLGFSVEPCMVPFFGDLTSRPITAECRGHGLRFVAGLFSARSMRVSRSPTVVRLVCAFSPSFGPRSQARMIQHV